MKKLNGLIGAQQIAFCNKLVFVFKRTLNFLIEAGSAVRQRQIRPLFS
ncbi:hypothetical protein LMANV2_280054 [Leptospira interrogans serovar Manilae]|uniref:Uncharacterized protein n=1 Tax=Leptospira interrogans serovar Manilae TaxID=214675 RepID=A0AAQ1NYZ7_LEPIR|nr:hypothetical protein LMANV2_280054 [Leptospira interrogans serovar Manilae]